MTGKGEKGALEGFRAGVLTVSDKGAAGERRDTSGEALKEILEELGLVVTCYAVVPDEEERIREVLLSWTEKEGLDLIITTGGTGFSPRDVTPEATAAVIERPAPGIAEAVRAAGLTKTPHAMLSRSLAGIRGRTLIINLPGSERAVRESLEVLRPVLPHALEILSGRGGECGNRK